MDPERKEDVVDKQLVHLVGMASAGSIAVPRLEIVVSSLATGLWFRSPILGASASSAIASSALRGR